MEKTLAAYLMHLREEGQLHTPQSLEVQVTDAIADGNEPLLRSILNKELNGILGVLSKDADRQMRYMYVTAAAVFCRAAVRGGVNYELACSMADAYCQEMDELPHLDHLLERIKEMAIGFCRHSVHYKESTYSQLVNTCCTYIQGHTHSNVTLSDLSDVTGMSTRRLSLHFREEVGMTIGEYTHRAKIKEAQILLQYTGHSISEVASYLGFCTQSHFTQVFKEITGMSPLEYKKQHHISLTE